MKIASVLVHTISNDKRKISLLAEIIIIIILIRIIIIIINLFDYSKFPKERPIRINCNLANLTQLAHM